MTSTYSSWGSPNCKESWEMWLLCWHLRKEGRLATAEVLSRVAFGKVRLMEILWAVGGGGS